MFGLRTSLFSKILVLLLSITLIFSVFTACSNTPTPPTGDGVGNESELPGDDDNDSGASKPEHKDETQTEITLPTI